MQKEQPINDIDTYFSIADELQSLEAMREEASSLLHSTIDSAILTAQKKLEEAENNQDISAELNNIADEAIRALAQIDHLKTSVDLGLISAEDLEEQRQQILNDVRIQRAFRVTHKSELIRLAGYKVESVAEDEDNTPGEIIVEDKKPEVDTTPPIIKITVTGDGVQIGERGKFVKLSQKTNSNQHDYSQERLAVLKVLVERAGQKIRASDLWESAFGEEVPYNKDAMTQIRVWLEKLTYRRSPIVEHNKARGPSSTYTISNPNVSINEIQRTTPKPQTTETPSISESDKLSPTPQVTVQKPEAQIEDEPTQESITAPVKTVAFPLTHAESLILAEFLDLNKELLKSIDMPTLRDGVSKRLTSGLKNIVPKLAEAIANNGGDLEQARQSIIGKIDRYFAEDNFDQVMEDITNIEILDYRYKLFEYLFELEEDQRKYLLEQLAPSIARIDITQTSGSFSSGVQIVDIDTSRVNNGIKLGASETEEAPGDLEVEPTAEEVEDIEKSTILIENEVVELQPQTISDEASTSTDESVADTPEIEDVEPSEIEIFEQNVRQFTKDVIELIDRYSLDGKAPKSIQAVDGFNWLTSKAVRNGAENNLISSEDKNGLKAKDIIMLALKNSFPDAFGVRKSAKKPNRTLINKIVDELLS